MIGRLDAPNEFGLRSKTKKWQYFTRFAELPNLPLSEVARAAKVDYESFEDVRTTGVAGHLLSMASQPKG